MRARIVAKLMLAWSILTSPVAAGPDQCFALDCVYSGPPAPTQTATIVGDIRILMMNVEGASAYLCRDRMRIIGDQINASVADPNALPYQIVGLNEVHNSCTETLLDHAQASGEFGTGKHRWGHPEMGAFSRDGGLGLLSTQVFEFTPYDTHVYTFEYNPIRRAAHGFLFAQIEVHPRVTLDVYVVHLHSQNEGLFSAECDRQCRRADLLELAEGIHKRSAQSGNPVLVMGDFNITGDLDGTCVGNCGYSDIMEALRHPRDLWLEDRPPASTTLKGQRIDYVFVPTDPHFVDSPYEITLDGRQSTILHQWVIPAGTQVVGNSGGAPTLLTLAQDVPVSDHFAIEATIRIQRKAPPPPSTPRPEPPEAPDTLPPQPAP